MPKECKLHPDTKTFDRDGKTYCSVTGWAVEMCPKYTGADE